ncbi:MAG: MBL fold metallo-hydrolase [Planctomycetota bacterium]|nr:MBL fold metallo-hydrolase [Planctomycetota bacterium]
MFGLIPRAVWQRTAPIDDKGRLLVQHNCLLLEWDGPIPTGDAKLAGGVPRRVLLEAGTGDKLDAKNREIFAMEDRSILDALREKNIAPESIDLVLVTHLHFDHAGGLTRMPRAGETPDWTGPASSFGSSRGDHGVNRTFPNARVVVQEREWRDALANRSVMTRTYFRDHLEAIESQLVLVDSPRPFAPGTTPDRDTLPLAPAELRRTPIAPDLDVMLVPGHTWGQQAMLFTDSRGRTVVFTPDVMPTSHHLGAAYSLAYDVEPYTSMISKRWLLDAAATHDWLLVLDHEAGHPVRRVKHDGKGWFTLEEAE